MSNLFTNTTSLSLKKRSDSILASFTKTREQLLALQAEQTAYVKSLEEQQDKLTAERLLVINEAKTTNKVISKIDDFLS